MKTLARLMLLPSLFFTVVAQANELTDIPQGSTLTFMIPDQTINAGNSSIDFGPVCISSDCLKAIDCSLQFPVDNSHNREIKGLYEIDNVNGVETANPAIYNTSILDVVNTIGFEGDVHYNGVNTTNVILYCKTYAPGTLNQDNTISSEPVTTDDLQTYLKSLNGKLILSSDIPFVPTK